MKNKTRAVHKFEAIFFDFGGVIAEEGFRDGLMDIAIHEGLEPERFLESATKAIYESGYVIGKASERQYWSVVREITGASMTDLEMKSRILRSFILRLEMIRIVTVLRAKKSLFHC